MAELETLFVRIETDLSAFKQGMAEARRETQGFAKEARSTFSGVGTALDLSPFRRELAASEAAAKQSAERMKKAFAEVGKVQLESARQVLKTLAQSIGRQPGQSAAKAGAEPGQPPGSKGDGLSDLFSTTEAAKGLTAAGIMVAILGGTAAAVMFPVSAPTIALFFALSAAIAGLTPAMNKFSDSLSADDSEPRSFLDDRTEDLDRQIAALQEKLKGLTLSSRPTNEADAEELKQAAESILAEIDSLKAEKEALPAIIQMGNDELVAELQRLAQEAAARTQEFLTAFTGLPESLGQLGGRIDELVRELLRIAGDAAAQSQELLDAVTELGDSLSGLCACIGGRPPPPDDPDPSRPDESEPEESGAGVPIRLASFAGAAPLDGDLFRRASFDGALFRRASFDGAAPLGGAGLDGLNRGLADAGFLVQDLSTGFMELAQATGGYETRAGALGERLIRTNALFGEQSELLDGLRALLPELGREVATMFEEGSEAGRVFAEVAEEVGASLLDAFEGAIERGESLSDVLKGLALDLARLAAERGGNALLDGLLGGGGGGGGGLLGGLLGGLFGGGAGGLGPQFTGTGALGLLSSGSFAKGAAFAPDSVMARNIKEFARGGIVDTPEAFAFAHGLGVMGEAGPEAILPLARARSGELGVRAMIGHLPEAGGSAPAAAGMTVFIDARGADREGLARVERKVHELRGDLIRVNQSIEPRALRAWLETRRRGGFR